MKQLVHPYSLTIVFLVFLPLILFCQNTNDNTKIDEWTIVSNTDIFHFEDTSMNMSFNDVLGKTFTQGQTENLNTQSVYWYRFTLPNKQPKKQLSLQFGITDFSDVYVPIKNKDGYQHYVVGGFAKQKETIVTSSQLYILTLQTDSIDFKRPFYFNKSMITHWSKNNWKYLPSYLFAENDISLQKDILQINYNYRDMPFYIGIVFISFFLFLVNFFISKNKSYLIYGLYLLGVTLYYANREPLFLNLYQKTIPELYFYVNQLAHISNIGCYTWFVFCFLDFKHDFPKVYPFTRKLLLGILIFGVLYGLQMVLFPYFPYRFLVMDMFRLIVMVISVGLFIFLMFQKPNGIAKIVLVGSLVLVAGNVLSLILEDFTIFLKLMILEIILFSAVVALKNKQIDNKLIKNKYDLEVEKMKIKTLEELDATKTRFYENITHEFRTPLTLILAPIERKLTKTSLSLNEKNDLNLIQRNAKRLLSLVNQMLDLAKLEEGAIKLSVKKGNLNTVLEPLISNHQQEALNKHIHFTQNVQNVKTVKTAWFDPDIVEKVTANLLSNALKYTPKNGNINIKSYTKDGYWVLETTNTINPNVKIDVSKLFTRYYRANKHTDGVGIGLNIAKELVELANGNIMANTLPDNKIQFTVSLPIELPFFTENYVEKENLIDQTETNNKKSSTVEQKHSTKLDTVENKHPKNTLPQLLIVEDNADMCDFIVSNLDDKYQILEADNGKTGVELAQKHLPDLIISDVMMPVKNGFELCNDIKQNTLTSHIPVILLTAKVGEENEIQGFKTGADAYITKPFSAEKLKVRTQKLIDAQKRMAEHYKNTFSINPDLAITDTEAEFLKRLKSVLNKHITNAEFNNEYFSELMQMSERQLHRKLKAVIGMTPTEFVRNERVKLAAELLKKSDATVSEIAYQVGFNTPSYFIKCFKEMYGCTPKEFSSNT